MFPLMLKSVNGPSFTRIVSAPASLTRPGCAGSVLPFPSPGRLNDPVTTPDDVCVRLNVEPASGPLVINHDPDIEPRMKERVSLAVPPLPSLTVRLAPVDPPVFDAEKMIVPFVPVAELPATFQVNDRLSPSGSVAAAPYEKRVIPAIPKPGLKFMDVKVGGRFVMGFSGSSGLVGLFAQLTNTSNAKTTAHCFIEHSSLNP
jgi:hypothetical protein